MSIKHQASVPSAEMRQAFMEASAELWDKNEERFLTLAEQSSEKAVVLSFKATLDFTDSDPSMEVDLSFGQRFKDKRNISFSNPAQPELINRNNEPVPFPGVDQNAPADPEGCPPEDKPKRKGKTKTRGIGD